MSQIDLPRRHHLDAIISEQWTGSDQNRWTPSVRYAWTASLESALYLRQLHTGAAYVRSFEMSNARDVTDYYLFYATNELLGLKKMKEAMWKTDESGEFRFSDATDPNQLVLF